jgi:hypothetical protein
VNGFTLLWARILDSSIWMESKETRIVWITMLAMKDKDGHVKAAKAALAHRARVTLEECEAALQVLMAPDPQSMTPDHEGRRIQEEPGGWLILNHDLYRFSTEAKREFWRDQKAKQRSKKKQASSPSPLPGELEHQRLIESGATQEQLDRHSDSHLPAEPEIPEIQ